MKSSSKKNPITPWGKAKKERERKERTSKAMKTATVIGGIAAAGSAIGAKVSTDKANASTINNVSSLGNKAQKKRSKIGEVFDFTKDVLSGQALSWFFVTGRCDTPFGTVRNAWLEKKSNESFEKHMKAQCAATYSKIDFNKKEASMKIGDTLILSLLHDSECSSCHVCFSSNKKTSWLSSDSDIATVIDVSVKEGDIAEGERVDIFATVDENGEVDEKVKILCERVKVTALSEGTVTISAVINYDGKDYYKKCVITVNK